MTPGGILITNNHVLPTRFGGTVASSTISGPLPGSTRRWRIHLDMRSAIGTMTGQPSTSKRRVQMGRAGIKPTAVRSATTSTSSSIGGRRSRFRSSCRRPFVGAGRVSILPTRCRARQARPFRYRLEPVACITAAAAHQATRLPRAYYRNEGIAVDSIIRTSRQRPFRMGRATGKVEAVPPGIARQDKDNHTEAGEFQIRAYFDLRLQLADLYPLPPDWLR